MKKILTGIACALFLCATSALAQVPHVLGVWEFDPQASELPKSFLLASETRSYDLRDDGYLVNVAIRKAQNGHPDFIQVVSKSDGKDYPQYQSVPLAELQINGTKTPLTYSETVLDEHAVNIVMKYGDRVIIKGVRRVAPDGKTMRIDLTAIDQNGKETPFLQVFNKAR
ncbi:MAG TPA: hypothetical protein VHH11_09670 [Gammaproteobacteria bacterium]|nr:hypothetical protein [Gammaproteobacteria bacterium]